MDESSYNLTCLPTGDWSGDLVSCINISCEPVLFEKKTVNQIVLENPTENLSGYQTKFTLSCGFQDDDFEFGEEIKTVDYYCNRRWISIDSPYCKYSTLSGWILSEPAACLNLSTECVQPLEARCVILTTPPSGKLILGICLLCLYALLFDIYAG